MLSLRRLLHTRCAPAASAASATFHPAPVGKRNEDDRQAQEVPLPESWESASPLIDALCKRELYKGIQAFDKMVNEGKLKEGSHISKTVVVSLFLGLEPDVALSKYREMVTSGYVMGEETHGYVVSRLCLGDLDVAIKMITELRDAGCLPKYTAKEYLSLYVRLVKKLRQRDARALAITLKDHLNGFGYCDFIARLVNDGGINEALTLLETMVNKGHILQMRRVYYFIIPALFNAKRDAEGLQMFETFVGIGGVPSPQLYGLVVGALTRSGRIDEALEVSRVMESEGFVGGANGISVLITGLLKLERLDEALRILNSLLDNKKKPELYVCNKSLEALCNNFRIEDGSRLFERLREAKLVDSVTYGVMMNGLAIGEQSDKMLDLYEEMQRKGVPVSFTTHGTVMKGLFQAGKLDQAVELFGKLQQSYELPGSIYNALIDGLCKAGKIELAGAVLDGVVGKGSVLSSYGYNSLMTALCKTGRLEDALRLFDRLGKDGAEPHSITYSILIEALFKAWRGREAERLFNHAVSRGATLDGIVHSAMIQGYCKTSEITEACRLFEEMVKQGLAASAYACSSLLDAVCKSNNLLEARRLFDSMFANPNLRLDRVVMYSTLMDAYSNACDVEEVERLFKEFVDEGGKPDMIMCTVRIKALCKTDRLNEAMELAEVGLKSVDGWPLTACYNAVFLALNNARRVEEAQRLFQRFLKAGGKPNKHTLISMKVRLRHEDDQ